MAYEDFMGNAPTMPFDEDDDGDGQAESLHKQDDGAPKQPEFDPNELPQELRGKSAREIGELFNQTIQGYRGLHARLQQLEASEPEPDAPEPFTAHELVENPEAFNQKLEQYAMAKVRPLMNQLTAMRAQQEGQNAVMRHPFLQKYGGELRAMLQHATPEQLANSQTWDAAALEIKQRHFEEIQRSSRKPSAPDTVRSRNNKEPNRGSQIQLTNQQRWIAKQLGLTEEQYIKGLEEQNG